MAASERDTLDNLHDAPAIGCCGRKRSRSRSTNTTNSSVDYGRCA